MKTPVFPLGIKLFMLAALTLLHLQKSFAQKIVRDTVYLQNHGDLTLWDNTTVMLYSFTSNKNEPSTLPGKVIEMEEGDSMHLYARSTSNDGFHTIHLHGLDVNTQNDGDPMTSFPLAPYSEYTYKFLATHAGTYIYHCHVGDVMHVQMGMYGLFIVKPKGSTKTAWTGGPAYSRSFSWLTSEVDKYWHENMPYAMLNDFTIPMYKPDYFLVNGKSHQQLQDSTVAIVAQSGEKVYLRLANTGFYKHQFIFPPSLNPRAIDSDGRPLPVSFAADTLDVMPGERYGVILSAPSSLTANVKINYIDMNTGLIKGTELVPVNVVLNVAVEGKIGKNKMLKLYPNPATELLNVSVFDAGQNDYVLKIKDLLGKAHSDTYCHGFDTKSIDISSFAKGMYILETVIEGVTFSEKFIVE